jgi:hypothetical protein
MIFVYHPLPPQLRSDPGSGRLQRTPKLGKYNNNNDNNTKKEFVDFGPKNKIRRRKRRMVTNEF